MKNNIITIDGLSENKQFHQLNRIGHNTNSNELKNSQLPQKCSHESSKIRDIFLKETHFGLV